MPVYAGIIREVYEIDSWHQAGTTRYQTRDEEELKKRSNRWEFIGRVASDVTRDPYIGCSVRHLMKQGQQSPILSAGI